MTGRIRKLTHKMRFFIGEGLDPLPITMPMSYATQSIVLERTEADVLSGKRGRAIECMNARCAMREARKFPHPVYFVEVTRSRVYVVDRRKNGYPNHCVMYYHADPDVAEFDVPGGREKIIKEGRAKKTITFLAPTDSIRHAYDYVPNPTGRKNKVTRRDEDKVLHRGVLSRARSAGIRIPLTNGA